MAGCWRCSRATRLPSPAWPSNGQTLASAGVDRTARLWRLAPVGAAISAAITALDVLICARPDQTDAVASIVFSPDGAWLASANWDHVITLWDVQSGQQMYN